MSPEMRDYIIRNNGKSVKNHGYIFCKYIDEDFVNAIKKEYPDFQIVQQTRTELRVQFDNCNWIMRRLRKSDRGIRPEYLILDARIDDELLHESGLVYNLGLCRDVEIISGDREE